MPKCYMKHPLLRGANGCIYQDAALCQETSPPTRGKQATNRSGVTAYRNIPSYEGQTSVSPVFVPLLSKHPLLRGANFPSQAMLICHCETSPPTRGKLEQPGRPARRRRNIPSYEGQTLSVYAAFSRLKHLVVQFAQI